ncbi:MAG: HXXEE domain-containing protein [Anaerolineae bacterium]|nr:HXXEE domain-containing protein [Anaerolineae bacterium]
MNRRVKVVYLLMVAVQVIHAAEEYLAGFYRVFPPARFIERYLPGLPRPGFVVFNALFVLFWLGAFLRWGNLDRHERKRRALFWAFAAIELYNGVAHLVWAALVRGYNPGLFTALPFLPLSGYAICLLRQGHLSESGDFAQGGV